MKSAKEKRPAGQKQYYRRKKVCKFCVERIDSINYKDVKLLSQFVPERAKIMPRRISGVCSPHQRLLSDAIKKARNIAILPFATEQWVIANFELRSSNSGTALSPRVP